MRAILALLCLQRGFPSGPCRAPLSVETPWRGAARDRPPHALVNSLVGHCEPDCAAAADWVGRRAHELVKVRMDVPCMCCRVYTVVYLPVLQGVQPQQGATGKVDLESFFFEAALL